MKQLLYILSFLLVSCSVKEPGADILSDSLPEIYPDYTFCTIPANIAPLRFMLAETAENKKIDDAVAVIECDGQKIIESSKSYKFLFNEDDWHMLLQSAKGKEIQVKVYTHKDSQWTLHKPFQIKVADEEIDSHLAYRLIPPGYDLWYQLGIYQRDLTSYKETAIAVNRLTDHNCMNCHSFNMQNPNTMMLHMRKDHGGTYIRKDGKIEKINGKVDEEIPNMVYPYWHPSGKYIAFSTNDTHQKFHMKDKNRIEVFDNKSNVFVYDVVNHQAITTPLLTDSIHFETFPTFSPDGKTLYYCSAPSKKMPDEYQDVHYSLCKISFDAEKGTFGTRIDTLYNATTQEKSVSFPRVSPDGKWLVFTLSNYGNFSIWHKDADLYIYNLATGEIKPLSAANSENVDSYHSWSSKGHWMVFSSRRDDGLYTRPYFTYIDAKGQSHKPFMLPQEDPSFYADFMMSYNIPELINGPATATPEEFAEAALHLEGQNVKRK